MLAAKAAIAGPYEGGRSSLAPLASIKTCATLLGSNLYSCNIIGVLSNAFHDCFQFSLGSGGGEQEDMPSISGFGALACDCSATGSTTNPKFDASTTAFMCEGSAFAFGNTTAALVGKVASSGNKIVKGALLIAGAYNFVFSCVVDPTCTP
jgi:hypothetical protein